MRKTFLFVLSAVITFNVQAQSDNKIVIGKIDSVYSKTLGEQRKIWVYTPDMTSANSNQHWPVVYLLDGDGHFASVVGMIQQMSQVNGNNVYPEMIVVAIPNTDRTRDLTPTHITNDPPMMDSGFFKNHRGRRELCCFY
jgi:predicted alpha/beta superfamily hydrolase